MVRLVFEILTNGNPRLLVDPIVKVLLAADLSGLEELTLELGSTLKRLNQKEGDGLACLESCNLRCTRLVLAALPCLPPGGGGRLAGEARGCYREKKVSAVPPGRTCAARPACHTRSRVPASV